MSYYNYIDTLNTHNIGWPSTIVHRPTYTTSCFILFYFILKKNNARNNHSYYVNIFIIISLPLSAILFLFSPLLLSSVWFLVSIFDHVWATFVVDSIFLCALWFYIGGIFWLIAIVRNTEPKAFFYRNRSFCVFQSWKKLELEA